MNIYIIRNNQKFGPYTESVLLSYVNNGQVLVQDKAKKMVTCRSIPLATILDNAD